MREVMKRIEKVVNEHGGFDMIESSFKYLEDFNEAIKELETADYKSICVKISNSDSVYKIVQPIISIDITRKIVGLIIDDLKERRDRSEKQVHGITNEIYNIAFDLLHE